MGATADLMTALAASMALNNDGIKDDVINHIRECVAKKYNTHIRDFQAYVFKGLTGILTKHGYKRDGDGWKWDW